jgi:hypothetical protein
MPYCAIIENREAGQEQFEQVKEHLRATGVFPPEGQRLLIAGPAEPGWRTISVWDSEEAVDRFYDEELLAACHAQGVPCERMTRTTFEVQTLVAGDLTGAPQPA